MFCRTYFRTFAKCDVCLTEFHLKLDARVSGIQSVGLNAKKFRVLEGLKEEHISNLFVHLRLQKAIM